MSGKAVRALLGVLLVTVALAGCTASTQQGLGGQSTTVSAPGYFSHSYQGSLKLGDEVIDLDLPGFTGNAAVKNTLQLSSGQVTVRVKDGAGAVVYETTVTGPGQATDSQIGSGEPGAWKLEISSLLATGQGTITIIGG